MHQWFILCGVNESLAPHILVNVIRQANTQGQYLTRRKNSKISTYRAVKLEHESGAPIDQQCFKLLCHLLESLKLNPNASRLLKVINDGLCLYATRETEREDDKQ
jgi:hypothetical protein